MSGRLESFYEKVRRIAFAFSLIPISDATETTEIESINALMPEHCFCLKFIWPPRK